MHTHRGVITWIANSVRRSRPSFRRKRAVLRVLAPRRTTSATTEGDLTITDLQARVAAYERAFGMTSEQFLERWRKGEAPDSYETNAWAMLLDVL